MRKLLTVFIICMSMLSVSVYAEILESAKISNKNQIGNVYSAMVENEGEYLVDGENNILGGPFEYVSNYSGFPYAKSFDGSKTLYDIDGSVLAKAEKGGEVYPPANGIYGVSPKADSTDVKSEFIIYDYATRKELFRTEKFFFYYMEQQSEKMFIERDGRYAIIDRCGNYLTDYVYDDVKKRFNPDYEPYPKAYAIVVIDGEERYIDRNLNEINLADYNGEPFITEFYHMKKGFDNFKEYYQAESGDLRAIYDNAEKKYLIDFQDEMSFEQMDEEFIIAKNDEGYGVIDYSGNTVVPFEYTGLSFSNIEGFMNYGKDGVSGLLDPYRNCVVTSVSGMVVDNGIMINHYTDYSDGYKNYCAEILNFAGRNLTGEVYKIVKYKDGNFYKSDFITDNPNDPVVFDRSFAVISLNGKYLDFDGTIRDGRTLVPIREIVEGLGGTVNWNSDTMTAAALIDGKEISMTIGNREITVNGETQVLDVPAQLINGKTMLPVRALCENLGAEVEWDERIRCVYITKKER